VVREHFVGYDGAEGMTDYDSGVVRDAIFDAFPDLPAEGPEVSANLF
jgi:hypothetical protein